MGSLSRAERTQIWIAAMDHSQAVLAVDATARKAALTGAAEDDMKAIKAQHNLDEARGVLLDRLQAHREHA